METKREPTRILFVLVALTAHLAVSCQAYEFLFHPDANREGVHLHFSVHQPSKVDILFVIDNSNSMMEEQAALKGSIDALFRELAGSDTSYRVGIVSTDAHGVVRDCNNQLNDPVDDDRHGALGICDPQRPVALRRPHDGTRGRLLAAYDATQFDLALAALPSLENDDQRRAFEALRPTAAYDDKEAGVRGVPWVIDREEIRDDACAQCGCEVCSEEHTCYDTCAEPVTRALVTAIFRSNMAGLGPFVNSVGGREGGFGWEEGIESALWAVGIDPNDMNDDSAIQPDYDLTLSGAPNSYLPRRQRGLPGAQATSWVRDDALLAILFLSDEEDCSMPDYLMDAKERFESYANLPEGSICYQDVPKADFHTTKRASDLVKAKKGSGSQVAVGFIGGVNKTGATEATLGRKGEPADCRATDGAEPFTDCSCLNGDDVTKSDTRWCDFTIIKDDPPSNYCDAFAGYRYVDFANRFSRHTFESVCRAEEGVFFGPAMADFAKIASLTCFELEGVVPADGNPVNITVRRLPQQDVGAGKEPQLLQRREAGSAENGWYYDEARNRICLTGQLNRLIGDVYDIFVPHTNQVHHTRD